MMADAAVVSLCVQVVAALNAAAGAGDFAAPLVAAEDYALTLPMQAVQSWRVAVQPGPSRTRPATLDRGVTDEISARVVVFRALEGPEDLEGIKAGLLLCQQLLDQICDRLPSAGYCFISAAPEGPDGGEAQAYDQDRLRSDGIFDAQFLVSFDAMRDQT